MTPEVTVRRQQISPLPLNLLEHFGETYVVEYEQAARAETNGWDDGKDAALQIIPCTNGHIFPWSSERLGASTFRDEVIENHLQVLACCRVEQDGDDGLTVSFPAEDFEVIAEVMKPVRKASLSQKTGERNGRWCDQSTEEIERLQSIAMLEQRGQNPAVPVGDYRIPYTRSA